MSRSTNSIRNTGVSFSFLAAKLFLTFFSRKLFIDYLGTDLIGLGTTLTNILGFLNLAELGITTVISVSLYKPLFEDDKEQINDIVSIFGYLFRRIGFVILGGGVVLSFLLPWIFERKGISLADVYFGFFILLASSLIGYFANYKQNLLDADQKNYVLTRIVSSCNLLKIIAQIVVLKWLDGGYKEWIGLEFLFAVLASLLINRAVCRHYSWLKTSWRRGRTIRKNYSSVFRTIRQIIPHKFGGYVLNQTSALLIFAFVSLTMVTVYTNYTIIITSILLLINTVSLGLAAGIGNLIAEKDREKIEKVFWEFQALYYLLGGISVVSLYYLTEPFIGLWLGNGFLLDSVSFVLLLFNTFVGIVRIPIGLYLNGYILYRDTWAPWTEAGINLGIAVVLGYFFGIPGILAGATVSLILIVVFWKPYFLYREAFHRGVQNYWRRTTLYLALLAVSWTFTAILASLLPFPQSYAEWGRNALCILLASSVSYFLLMFLCTKETRNIVVRILDLAGIRRADAQNRD